MNDDFIFDIDDTDFDWDDVTFDDSIPAEWETASSSSNSNPHEDVYYLEGYGQIYELDDYLGNSNGIIELLEHAKSKEQFNYILGMSKEDGHDENLLQYLISVNYSIEDYLSINVGYQIFKYKELVEYLLSIANDEQVKGILEKVAYVDDKIAGIVSVREDKTSLIRSNYHLRDKLVTQKIIEHYKKNPNQIDFGVLEVCDLDTELIKEFLNLGYKISLYSPSSILGDNQIMKTEFLNKVPIDDMDTFHKLDGEIDSIPGSYGRLYQSQAKEIFSNGFSKAFGKSAFEQMIKYIVLGDYQIDLSKINEGNIFLLKSLYDLVSNGSSFDIQLFTKIVYKYNRNPDLFKNINLADVGGKKLRIYFEFEELMVSDIQELQNIEEALYQHKKKTIESSDNLLDIKNVICNLLTNQTYFETKKGLLELANKEKLSVLKNCIKNEEARKALDSYIILSEFLEKVDRITDVSQLREMADLLNRQVLEKGIPYKWMNFNRKIMNFYSLEANEKMTDFNEHLTDAFYDATDYTFGDGTSVKGRRVKVAHIKSGEEFNSLIHVLNAYQNGRTTGTIESINSPKFIGQAYISLSGISDEYSRICVNQESRFSIKVLYSSIPSGDLFCASNRDTGINAKSNSKNIYTRLPANMLPFRRLVRNTETHGSETYNEYDVFRDNLVPSGIAFMGDEPTEEEINAAAYLGVPLVKIDDLQESFRKDLRSLNKWGLAYDESFYHIKEHGYEDQEVIVSPSDEYDVILDTINGWLNVQEKSTTSLEVFAEKDETGYEDYYVSYQGEKYEATPVYEYVASRRINIETDFYEKSLIKEKLYKSLGIEPRTKFVSCRYPNGKELFSVIENTKEARLIDNCIKYLVDLSDFSFDITDFSECSSEDIELLKKIDEIPIDNYISLFESLIRTEHYIEPNLLLEEISRRKEKASKLLSDYYEFRNQSQNSSDLMDMLESDSSHYVEENKVVK